MSQCGWVEAFFDELDDFAVDEYGQGSPAKHGVKLAKRQILLAGIIGAAARRSGRGHRAAASP